MIDTPNSDPLLDPNYARAEALRHFAPQLSVAREITQAASDLFKRAFASNQKEVPDLIVIVMLFRQAIMSLDSAVLLLENGAVAASNLHARALWEASLYIEWILEKGKERWARQLYVYSLRQELLWARRAVAGSDENVAFVEAWTEAFGEPWTPDPAVATDAARQEQEILTMLQSSHYQPINETFENWNRPGEPDWFRPGADAPKSLYEMAKILGRRAEYNALYKSSSYYAHGVKSSHHFSVDDGGFVSVEPIRSLEDFPSVFMHVMNFGLRVIMQILREYRPGEELWFTQTYTDQWRARLTPPRVRVNPQHIKI